MNVYIIILKELSELARTEFRQPHRDLESKLAEAKKVSQFLKRNFVQAINQGDNYYKLNLTTDHEINDKIEPIKTPRRCC